MKRVILFGAPGAGKGTQAEIIRTRLGYVKISTGELIRAEVKSGSAIGLEVRSVIDQGELVPDEIMIDMVKKRLAQADIQTGYILDGFPRTPAQARALEMIPVDHEFVFYMKVGDPEKVVGRAATRLTCTRCGVTFSQLSKQPKLEGICDNCGGELIRRSDDQADTIRQRILIYRRETKPVIDFFRQRGTLIDIDASKDIETVAGVIGGYLQ